MMQIGDAKRPVILHSCGLVVLVLSLVGSAQEPGYSPADFGTPNRLATLQISTRDMPRDISALAVRCQAFVESDGSLGTYSCVSDDSYKHRRAVSAVIDVIPQQAFVPARVAGEAVRVLMNFAVFIDCSSGSCLTIAVRNHGFHIQELGLDYVSPQPILEGNSWYEGFDYKMAWIEDWMPRVTNSDKWPRARRFPFVIATNVTEHGLAEASCLYWVGREYGYGASDGRSAPGDSVRAIEDAVDSMGQVRYVPAFINEEPAALRLYESGITQIYIGPRSGATELRAFATLC